MIQNITQGSNFRGAATYVHSKDGAERVAGNMAGRNPRELEREWNVYREMNGRVQEDVCHVSLSLAEGERLDGQTWEQVANSYVEQMGFSESSWVAYRHTDTGHDHIHILANRVDFDGSAVDMWRSYQRGEDVCRQLEQEHGLVRVRPSREADKAAPTRSEFEMYQRTGEVSVKMDLQSRVDAASRRADTMGEYAKELEEEGVYMQLRRRDDGTPYGVSYVRGNDGEMMKGSDLGRAFSWGGLQKKAGINHEYERDDAALRESEKGARAARAAREVLQRGAGEVEGADRSVEREDGRPGGQERGADVGRSADSERLGRDESSPERDSGGNGEQRRIVRRPDGRKATQDRSEEGGARESTPRGDAKPRVDRSRRVVRRSRADEQARASRGNHSRGSESADGREQIGASARAEVGREAGQESRAIRRSDRLGDQRDADSSRMVVSERSRPQDRDPGRRQTTVSRPRSRDRQSVQQPLDRRGERIMENSKESRRQDEQGQGVGDASGAKLSKEESRQLHNEHHHRQMLDEYERQDQGYADKQSEQYQMSDDMQREIWKEDQIANRIGEGQEYVDQGRLRGKVEEVEDFGDKSAAVVADKDRFAVVDVEKEQAKDLSVGDNVEVSQSKESAGIKHVKEQERGVER